MSGKPKVTIVDYEVGNLLSVVNALNKCGAESELTCDPKKIKEADYLILPGVGAFKEGMKALKKKSLIEPIMDFSETNRPFLGICLGMQLMFDLSFEHGEYSGLGLISGEVRPIPKKSANGSIHKIPHIGWSKLIPPKLNFNWDNSILDKIDYYDSVYFVHSYAAFPKKDDSTLAYCDYNGIHLTSVVRNGNLYGCQFHPERSGPVGLKIIKSFCFA
tara:strand:+ start:11014 stop:11664 length:651 start_codon:yes stop_codon:yes gene_type:complete